MQKKRFSASLETFKVNIGPLDTHGLQQKCAGKKESYKSIRINMFAAQDKSKPDIRINKKLILGGGQAYDRSSG
jgi:hypothetical protein